MLSENAKPHITSGVRAGRGPVGTVRLRCAACRTPSYVAHDAKTFRCSTCEAAHVFYTCEHCQAALMVPGPDGQPPTRWACGACGQTSAVPRFGPLPVLTAGQFSAAGGGVDDDAADEPATVQMTGFTVLVSHRTALPAGMTCSVIAHPDGVTVQMPDGPRATFALRYEDLEILEVGGRSGERRTRSGGSGQAAGPRGVLRATDRHPGECVLRFAGAGKTLVLAHPTRSAEHVLSVFAEMLERWDRAHAAQSGSLDPVLTAEDAIAQLERVTALHHAGGLTDQELEAIRAPLIAVLTGRTGVARSGSQADWVG